MHNSFVLFKKNIEEVQNLSSLHNYLKTTISSPFSFDDILRSQIVYSVSAFDKLIHDLIRSGMVQTYLGKRVPTPKYLSEPISLELHQNLNIATIPPKEYVFEQIVFNKLKIMSFQDPSKISDGLSYIWSEGQKWKKISSEMGMEENNVKVKLRLIASRRNAIVHEADIDPITNIKISIEKPECDDITNFLSKTATAIYNLIS